MSTHLVVVCLARVLGLIPGLLNGVLSGGKRGVFPGIDICGWPLGIQRATSDQGETYSTGIAIFLITVIGFLP